MQTKIYKIIDSEIVECTITSDDYLPYTGFYNFLERVKSLGYESKLIEFAGEDKETWDMISKYYFSGYTATVDKIISQANSSPYTNNPNFRLRSLGMYGVIGLEKINRNILENCHEYFIPRLLESHNEEVYNLGLSKFYKLILSKFPDVDTNKDVETMLEEEGVYLYNKTDSITRIVHKIVKCKKEYESLDKLYYDDSIKYNKKGSAFDKNGNFTAYYISKEGVITTKECNIKFSDERFKQYIPELFKIRHFSSDATFFKCINKNRLDILSKFLGDNKDRWNDFKEVMVGGYYCEGTKQLGQLLRNENLTFTANDLKSYHHPSNLISPELLLKLDVQDYYKVLFYNEGNIAVVKCLLYRLLSLIFPNNKTYLERSNFSTDEKLYLDEDYKDVIRNMFTEEHHKLEFDDMEDMYNNFKELTEDYFVKGKDFSKFNSLREYYNV